MDSCEYNSWSEIYFTQLFTTLGQLSAVLISGTVAVPVVSYYSKSIKTWLWNKQD
jgi:hypothetical protein